MVFVQLPELAVDHVEVLVAEEVGDLVDIVLVLEGGNIYHSTFSEGGGRVRHQGGGRLWAGHLHLSMLG